MKTKIILFALIAIGCAHGQVNARFSVSFPSITSQYSTPFLVANIPPNSVVPALCNHPANATPCTNYATTYTQSGVACPNGTQDTPDPQPSSCQATADAQGNIGFWLAPGTYDYTACIQNSTSCFGPYTIIVALPDNHGSCTMSSGSCPAIVFAKAFLSAPICTVTWSGTGTLTGIIKSQRTTTGLQPASSVGSDSAVVDWKCEGNPN